MDRPISGFGSAPLVGRAGPLRLLLDVLDHAPSVALVEGEAGVGKTRLIREALDARAERGDAGASTVLLGACPPLREPFPYGPVFDTLRTIGARVPSGLNPVCGVLRPYLPELADRLPPQPEPLADPGAAAHRLFRAVRALLDALGPVVWIVEDLHRADDGTRDLVRFLVDDPPTGLCTVLSYRREDIPGAGLPLGRAYRHPPAVTSVIIPLAPLEVSDVRALAGAITGRDVSAELAGRLHERTAGIPFVIEEFVRCLGGDEDTLDSVTVPVLFQEAMADRLLDLDPDTVGLVHAAAVLRVPASAALISSVAGLSDIAATAGLKQALKAGVLHEVADDLYGFRHGLAQQAVYDSLLRLDQRRLHAAAVDALSGSEGLSLVQLAHHARGCGDTPAWRAFTEKAAESAHAVGDTALAVELLEGLLADTDLPAPDRARLAVRLSRIAVIGLAHSRSTRLLRRSVEDPSLPEAVRGEIRLNLGLLLNNQAGNHIEGRADTERAVAELRERPELAARAMAGLAMPIWGEEAAAVHQAWIDRAEEQARRHDSRVLHLAVRGNHLALRMTLGDATVAAEADALLTLGGTTEGTAELARMCANLADSAAWLGRDTEAVHFARQGARLARSCGAPFLHAIVEGTRLRLDWTQGRRQGLGERARRLLGAAPGVSGVEAEAHLVLGLLAMTRGEWDSAGARLAEAALADPVNTSAPLLAAASAAMIWIHLYRGDDAVACAEADRAVPRIRRKEVWGWAGDLLPAAVLAWARAGRFVEARALVAEFESAVEGRHWPLAAAALLACHGTLARAAGDHARAVDCYERAAASYAALPAPYAAARCTEAAAECAATDAERPLSAEELTTLSARYEALEAPRDAARCRRALRADGHFAGPRRGRRGYGTELSPREREVARLLSSGLTNREIAQALFLSPRTVEQHVAKVLRKLHVTSRADVAAAALRQGDTPEPD
nr:LuxR family transcriptional regulator [Streptomyces sp. SID8379]